MESLTIAKIFEAATSAMTGFMSMTVQFFTGLWAHPMGQLVCVLGLVSGAIGLCYKLFLRRKHI